MKPSHMHWVAALLVAVGVVSCNRQPGERVQGYVEGEFVYVACPSAGALEALNVQRGAQVKPGDALYSIESISQQAARDEAARRVAQAKASMEDIRKGRRPSEIDSIEAQLGQAKASLDFSTSELARQESLTRNGAASAQEMDRARTSRDHDQNLVAQIHADLATARLGQRDDQIVAAEANLRATESVLARAEWDFSQTKQSAKQAGIVFDTFYRPGEWVAAGKPVVALLPPGNVKVRTFVPQDRASRLQAGQHLTVFVDGVKPVVGSVSFISPKVEYTPPVIYGQESRGKLVIMVELVFDPQIAASLHPGQPVDVRLEP